MINNRYGILKTFVGLCLVSLLASCGSSRQISYFKDMNVAGEALIEMSPIKVMSGDKLSIVVHSKDPILSSLFNLPIISLQMGKSNAPTLNQYVSAYTVDASGMIDFPVVGKLQIAGLEREQVASLIKTELVNRNLIKDPVIIVEFVNLFVSVLGEVNKPGRFVVDRDNITILDAIGMAGDLTIYGKRNNIKLLRTIDDKQVIFDIDLNSGSELYRSPAFYLRQGDVIYVEPNKTRARQSTVNGNTVRSTSFWLSLTSALTSVSILILNATRLK